MAKLKVKLRGKLVQEFALDENQSYIAGRKEDCDIVLSAEKGISREHFQLSPQNGVWFVNVISKYGEVLIGGTPIHESQQLEHGMSFSVPPYEFEFSVALADVGSEIAVANEDFNEEKTFVGAARSIPYIKALDATGDSKEIFRLEGGDSWVAGREATAAICIRDQRVSRKQFEVRKINEQYFITDLGSVNGTAVNGKVVGDDLTPLRSGDIITVLDNQFIFELHDPGFRKSLEMVVMPTAPVVSFDSDSLLPDVSAGYHPPAQYDMTAPMPMPHQTQVGFPGALPGAKPKFDFEKNRPKLIIGAVAFLVLAWFFSSDESGQSTAPKKENVGVSDAFSKLKPEEQLLVKQTHQLAKNYYMTGKYELAQSEINKIYQLVPDYEDVRQIERLSREAIAIQEQKRRQEELAKVRRESEKAIQEKADECAKTLNPNITVSQIEECLSSVIALEPSHPRILELKAKAQSLTEEREARAAQQEAYQENVNKLVNLFARAESLRNEGSNLAAMDAYDKVMASSLPDPRGLKSKSRSAKQNLQAMMSSKTATYLNEAEKLHASQNLKGAILALRKAKKIDPRNTQLQDKIDIYMNDLRKQMMVLYQEGILEESFGNVDGSETKPGAKDRWKKILELDVTDGEYYKKAYIKLKKYGAL